VSYPPHVQGNGHPGPPHRTSRSQPAEKGSTPVPPSQPAPGTASPQMPPMEMLQARFEELLAGNQQRFADLAAKGVAPDPFFIVHARINHLIDQIAAATGPNGPRWGLMTRIGFEEVIARELAQAGPQTTRMQLADGARYSPGMIAELARQAGTFRRAQ